MESLGLGVLCVCVCLKLNDWDFSKNHLKHSIKRIFKNVFKSYTLLILQWGNFYQHACWWVVSMTHICPMSKKQSEVLAWRRGETCTGKSNIGFSSCRMECHTAWKESPHSKQWSSNETVVLLLCWHWKGYVVTESKQMCCPGSGILNLQEDRWDKSVFL